MTTYIALLRAINVGGTGKLPMADLVRLCESLGYTNVRIYIQSGNVVFQISETEPTILRALETALHQHMGKPVDVMLRTAAELHVILAANPFPGREPNKVHIVFLAVAPPLEAQAFSGSAGEQGLAGFRELYIYYPLGQGQSNLKLPLGKTPSTARNLNTVAKLAALSET